MAFFDPKYRITESRCSNGKSTFYAEQKKWYGGWERLSQHAAYDVYVEIGFDSLEAARAALAKQQVTCSVIVHSV